MSWASALQGPKFCPACGASDWESRVPRKDDKPRQCCRPCGYVHYVGPVLAAGIIVRCEGRYCLVRRAHEPAKGKWSFPGGFVDLDEDPAAAAEREVREETGVEVRAEELIGLYRSTGPAGKQVVIAVYLGDVSPAATQHRHSPTEEVADVGWFAADEIPWPDLAFDSTTVALRAVSEAMRKQ